MQGLSVGIEAISRRALSCVDRAAGAAQKRARATEEALTTLLLACAAAAVIARPGLVGLGPRSRLTPLEATRLVQDAWPVLPSFAASGVAPVAHKKVLQAARALAVLPMAQAALGCVFRARAAGSSARSHVPSRNAAQHMRDAVHALNKHKDGERFYESVALAAQVLEPGSASVRVRATTK